MKSNHVIGIDLGTTNSEVAIIKDGIPTLLSIDGSPIVPSIVSITPDNQVLVGKQARNNAVAAPEQTISLIKRKMGNKETLSIHGKDYTPPMISSFILGKLKRAAEDYLKEPVTQAVITVPAFFNENQREATKEAAELAGLEVLRLLNEPTSAALCYAMKKNCKEINLIYDLGGGTFDVSIVDLSHDVMEVRASHGNTELGGSDFDLMIYEQMRQKILSEHNIDISNIPSSRMRLLYAAENAKITLSSESSATIFEEFLFEKNGRNYNFEFKITRAEFEHMIHEKLEETLNSVKEAMAQAQCTAKDISRVILVGGSTKIPLVAQMLEQELEIVPQSGINPDTVVALGAAIEAANLNGEKIGSFMVDITPHSLGVECMENFFFTVNSIMIHKNTPLPATATKVFSKVSEETKSITISAYQGESKILDYCKPLGKFELNGLTPNGKDEILVKIELDRSGLINVTATEIGSGISHTHSMKRINRSEIVTKNLADLNSVKLNLEEDSDVELFEGDKSFCDVTTIRISPELEMKVKNLLSGNKIDETSKDELKTQYDAVISGEKGALENLENLVYYME